MEKHKIAKKGALTDLFVFMIITFVMIISFAVIMFAANAIRTQLTEHDNVLQANFPDINTTTLRDNTIGSAIDSYSSLNWITFMVIVGMVLSIIVTSFLVETRPVFFVPYIFVWIIAIIVSVPLANSYELLYEDPTLGSSIQFFSAAKIVLLNLPVWITVIGGIAGIVMFVGLIKNRDVIG